jgi:hypothetical protein
VKSKPAVKTGPALSRKAATLAKTGARSDSSVAAPADHSDPRFTAVLAAFAADPARAEVAEDFAANQMAGGRKKFGSRALKVDGSFLDRSRF